MIVNFCETASFQQMCNELSYVVNKANLPAKVDCYCNSVTIMFSPNVELTTAFIVLFANVAKRHKCNFSVSNYCDCLTFAFSCLS